MLKSLLRWSGFALAVAGVLGAARPALAVKQFKDEFEATYVKPGSADAKDKAFAATVEKAGCAICHPGESKKQRNVYGIQVSKLVSKKDKQDSAKIRAALEKVAGMKVKPGSPDSPTFGDRIRQGKLPAGDD